MKHAEYVEKKRHGSPDFPIEYYYLDKEQPQYIMPPHWHKEFEIIRVLKGTFAVHLNNTEYLLQEGDILFVEGGCLHRGEPQNGVYECLVFDPAMLKRQQNDVAEKYISPIVQATVGINRLSSPCDCEMQDTVAALFTAMRERQPYYELRVYGLLFDLFAQLYAQKYILPCEKVAHSHQTQTIIQLIDWMEKNFAEPISLQKLSVLSGLTPKYLCRVFKEYTSKTPMEYINELRIENACYEMSIRGKNITAASYDSGFNDLSYFCKIFKRHKGITPREYKSRHL